MKPPQIEGLQIEGQPPQELVQPQALPVVDNPNIDALQAPIPNIGENFAPRFFHPAPVNPNALIQTMLEIAMIASWLLSYLLPYAFGPSLQEISDRLLLVSIMFQEIIYLVGNVDEARPMPLFNLRAIQPINQLNPLHF